MTPDPIGLEGGINLYAYVGGNPINWFDPEGLSCSPNGCGPGGSSYINRFLNWIIPEGFFAGSFGYDFAPACNEHDKCYSKCGADKKICDLNFLNDMEKICDRWVNKLYGPGGGLSWIGPGTLKNRDRSACNRDAKMYYDAVDKGGDGPFADAQANCCP